jgi:sugar phosphate isomerase/epimerase
MRVGERLDLTYCSNIHPGERWPDVSAALAASLPRIRALLAHDGPLAIGVRLSAEAARALEAPEALARFRDFLRAGQYYVPTLNGFPYGAFHGTRVKERVYLPDWRDPERLDYTNRLARLLAVLAADAGLAGASVSTVPGAFRGHVQSEADVASIAAGILAHAAYLRRLREETGVTIALAIEPEPACVLETVDDALAFFREYLLAPAHRAQAARAAGTNLTQDEVLRHVGLCMDACHMAVAFEDAAAAIERAREAGVRILKVQLSSALQYVRRAGGAPAAGVLGRFAEDTYLHQVVVSGERGLAKFTDLPDALAAEAHGSQARGEWRVHFHVPIFLETMQGFGTTQSYLREVLRLMAPTLEPVCLEIETYTWDVLPPEYRTTDACSAIARELQWVLGELETVKGLVPGHRPPGHRVSS